MVGFTDAMRDGTKNRVANDAQRLKEFDEDTRANYTALRDRLPVDQRAAIEEYINRQVAAAVDQAKGLPAVDLSKKEELDLGRKISYEIRVALEALGFPTDPHSRATAALS